MELLSLDISERVATVTLNDPDRRNALTLPMVEEIESAFENDIENGDVGAVVITGAGTAFCAGADLSHLGSSQREGLLRIYEGFLRIGRCPLPTIAAVNGAAVGAGMNLALICDLRLAARRAKFDTRFLQLGLHPGGGHTWMFRRIAGPQVTAAAVLFGEVLDGDEAARAGLVWQSVDDDQLLPRAQEMAARAAAAPIELVRRVKATITEMADIDNHPEAVQRELDPQIWSLNQPAFQERLAALQAKISSR